MLSVYQERKLPKEQKDAAAERTEASGPARSALSAGQATPPSARNGGSFDLEAAMKAKMERSFGDLSAVKQYRSAHTDKIGAGPGADLKGGVQAAGDQPYTGPVTHAISSDAPSPSAAGPMQAKKDKTAKAPNTVVPVRYNWEKETEFFLPGLTEYTADELDEAIADVNYEYTLNEKVWDQLGDNSWDPFGEDMEVDPASERRPDLLRRRIMLLGRSKRELQGRALKGVYRMNDEDAESPLEGRELTDETEAADFLGMDKKGANSRWLSSLTKEERSALEHYTLDKGEGNYNEVNTPLRTGVNQTRDKDSWRSLSTEETEKLDRQRTDMDSAIEKYELKEPMIVHRGSSADMLGGLTDPDKIMQRFGGRVVRDRGYVSTSVLEKEGFEDDNHYIHYKISVPAGKGHGAFISPLSHFHHEQEFLLKRNTSFVVMNAYLDKNGKTVVELQA